LVSRCQCHLAQDRRQSVRTPKEKSEDRGQKTEDRSQKSEKSLATENTEEKSKIKNQRAKLQIKIQDVGR